MAEHFNTAGHSIDDTLVRGMMLSVDNVQQKRLEMRLIFQFWHQSAMRFKLRLPFPLRCVQSRACTSKPLHFISNLWHISTMQRFQRPGNSTDEGPGLKRLERIILT